MKAGFLLPAAATAATTDRRKHHPELGPLRDQRSHRPTWGTDSATPNCGGWGSGGDATPRWTTATTSTTTGFQSGASRVAVNTGDEANTNAQSSLSPASLVPLATTGISYANVLNQPHKTRGVPMVALTAFYGKTVPSNHNKDWRMSDYYHVWDDGNPKNHLVRHTCVLCCPLTGELFQAGQWPGDGRRKGHSSATGSIDVPPSKKTEQSNDNERLQTSHSTAATAAPVVVATWSPWRWMSQKKQAEHGAAAWAYDCFHFRLERGVQVESRLGEEEPYLVSRFELPDDDVDEDADFTTAVMEPHDTAVNHVPKTSIPLWIRDRIRHQQDEIRERNRLWALNVQTAEVEQAWHQRQASVDETEERSGPCERGTDGRKDDSAMVE